MGHDQSKAPTPEQVERAWTTISGRARFAKMQRDEQLNELREALDPGLPQEQVCAALDAFRNHCTLRRALS